MLGRSLFRLRPFSLSSSASVFPLGGRRLLPILSPHRRQAFSTDNNNNDNNTSCKEEMSEFPGAPSLYTSELKFEREWVSTPCFRRITNAGEYVDNNYQTSLSDETLVKMYKCMTTLNVLDNVFYDTQRQGRISFYMTNTGEEATHIGSAAALDGGDTVFGQYREAGVLMWRGFTLEQFANQCFSNELDLGKGRQMPVHYGSNALNFQTISSPLSTQIPQAAGAAYALKREGKKNCVICYFGDGAASEGDFHVALNMAATLECPVIFFVRNNGYAISTPTKEQYRGDGIASRGRGYGMATIRVDGNDVLAVYDATQAARKMCVEEGRPVLLEAMTYRLGHHSTSDDSTRYRSTAEISKWNASNNPISRLRLFLERKNLWDSEQEAALRSDRRKAVLASMTLAEKLKKPSASQLFTDVYDVLPQHLREQQRDLLAHLKKYGQHYGLGDFAEEDSYVDPAKTP
jgi:2-oxoisovalerate dehydrogenase E1 component alpha subunit